jgi:hypothetical protein
MPPFPDVSEEGLQALQAYVINQAWKSYEGQERNKPSR